MPFSMGSRLGPYEIGTSIGEGGMGEVYKARDTRLARIVAIKVSKSQFSERFAREAKDHIESQSCQDLRSLTILAKRTVCTIW